MITDTPPCLGKASILSWIKTKDVDLLIQRVKFCLQGVIPLESKWHFSQNKESVRWFCLDFQVEHLPSLPDEQAPRADWPPLSPPTLFLSRDGMTFLYEEWLISNHQTWGFFSLPALSASCLEQAFAQGRGNLADHAPPPLPAIEGPGIGLEILGLTSQEALAKTKIKPVLKLSV